MINGHQKGHIFLRVVLFDELIVVFEGLESFLMLLFGSIGFAILGEVFDVL